MQLYTSTLLLLAGSTAAFEWSFGSISDVQNTLTGLMTEAEKHGIKINIKSIENSGRQAIDAYIKEMSDKGLDWVANKNNRGDVAKRADAVDAEFTSRLDQAEAYKNKLKSQAEEFRKKYSGTTVFKVKQGLNKEARVYINGVENEHFKSIALELLKGTNSGIQKQFREKTFGFNGRVSLEKALKKTTRRAEQEVATLKQKGKAQVKTAENDAIAELKAAKKKCNTYFGGDCEKQFQAARTLVLSFDKRGDIESALEYGKTLMAKVEGVAERV